MGAGEGAGTAARRYFSEMGVLEDGGGENVGCGIAGVLVWGTGPAAGVGGAVGGVVVTLEGRRETIASRVLRVMQSISTRNSSSCGKLVSCLSWKLGEKDGEDNVSDVPERPIRKRSELV